MPRPVNALLPQRLPSLDGWRAVSIVLVLGAHSATVAGFPPHLGTLFNWLFDSNLGVRFFFIISGFLITWLLLIESDQRGRASLRLFYIRRALRILPVYLAFLSVIAALQFLTAYNQNARTWIGNLTFTTNFVGAGWTTGHLWSLSVEEQFYLLWPALLLLSNRETKAHNVWYVLAVPILVCPLVRVVTYAHLYPHLVAPLFSPYSFFYYFDSLAIGCGSALLFFRCGELIRGQMTWRPKLFATAGIALILLPYFLTKLFWLGTVTVPLGPTFQGVGFAILLMQSVVIPTTGFYRILNTACVVQIGVLSYSIYIWQQIFCTSPALLGFHDVWWMSFPGWLLPVFVVAGLSYYGLERPLLKLRRRFYPKIDGAVAVSRKTGNSGLI
jgi:peptidoglycan/LPS O-acetylase OafA/YrhL